MGLVYPPASIARISDGGRRVISAERIVRVLGNAQNRLLVSASDSRLYVLRLYEDHTKNRSLLRKSLGTELAACLGLPVARWRPIHVSNDFIDAFSHIWTRGRPSAGTYFGSEMIGQNTGELVSEFLPTTWFDRLENRSAFIGALMLDIWTSNPRSRRVVFLRKANSARFQAVFVGFREMFSTQVDYSPNAMAGRYCRRGVYEGLWNESAFFHWQREIVSLRQDRLWTLLFQLPKEWVDRNDAGQIVSRLVANQKMIKTLEFRSFDPCAERWVHPGAVYQFR